VKDEKAENILYTDHPNVLQHAPGSLQTGCYGNPSSQSH
jgi:hypothetical protein